MTGLYGLLLLDGRGKTSKLGVCASCLEQAKAIAVACAPHKPAVIVTVLSAELSL